MSRSLVDNALLLIAKAEEQGSLFDAPLVPVKKVVHRKDGTHVQTYHVKPGEAPAAPQEATAPPPIPAEHHATGALLPAQPMKVGDDWGALVPYAGVQPGQRIRVTARDGRTWEPIVGEIVSTSAAGTVVTTIRTKPEPVAPPPTPKGEGAAAAGMATLFPEDQLPITGHVYTRPDGKRVVYDRFARDPVTIDADAARTHGEHLRGHEGKRGVFAIHRTATDDDILRSNANRDRLLLLRARAVPALKALRTAMLAAYPDDHDYVEHYLTERVNTVTDPRTQRDPAVQAALRAYLEVGPEYERAKFDFVANDAQLAAILDPAPAAQPAPRAVDPEAAPVPTPHTRDVTGQHDDVLTRYGLPLGTSVEIGVRSPLTRGKYRVGNSNYHDTVEAAAAEAMDFMRQSRAANQEADDHAAASASLAKKLRAGEQPTKDEWTAVLGTHYEARRQVDDGYIEQAAISGFLREHFPHKGFTASQIRKHLGAAAIETENQWGKRYPAVRLARLPEILRDAPATPDDADPPGDDPPAPPDSPEALDARLTDALRSLIADPKERIAYAQLAAADAKVGDPTDPEYRYHARRAAALALGGGYKGKDTATNAWRARLYDTFSDKDKRLAPLTALRDSRFPGQESSEAALKSRAAYGIAVVRAEPLARHLLADLPNVIERPQAPPLPPALAEPEARIPARPKLLGPDDWGAFVPYSGVKIGQIVRITTRAGKSREAVVVGIADEDERGTTVRTARMDKAQIAKGADLADLADRLVAKALDPGARAAPPKAAPKTPKPTGTPAAPTTPAANPKARGLVPTKTVVRRDGKAHVQTFHKRRGDAAGTAPAPAQAEQPKAGAVKPTATPKYEHATVVAPDIHLPKYDDDGEQLPNPAGPGTHALVKMHDTHPLHPGHEFRVPKASLAHHLDEMHGRVTGKPNHTSEHVNAVLRGDAEYLGRGNDGMAFKVGDKVVKVGGVTPFQPSNHHAYRTPEEAARRLHQDATLSERLRASGVPMMPKTEIHHHEGRAFMVRDHLDIPEKFTKPELDEIAEGMTALHRSGHALKDQIQVGRGKDGHLYHFDTGTLDVNRTYDPDGHSGPDDDILRDHERLEALYRQHGHTYEPKGGPMLHRQLRKHAREAMFVGQNHGDKHDPDDRLSSPEDYDLGAHTEKLHDLHARVVADVKKHHTGSERDRLLAEADEHLKLHAKMYAKGRKMREGLNEREAARAKG